VVYDRQVSISVHGAALCISEERKRKSFAAGFEAVERIEKLRIET
jgi:hypothetical protein